MRLAEHRPENSTQRRERRKMIWHSSPPPRLIPIPPTTTFPFCPEICSQNNTWCFTLLLKLSLFVRTPSRRRRTPAPAPAPARRIHVPLSKLMTTVIVTITGSYNPTWLAFLCLSLRAGETSSAVLTRRRSGYSLVLLLVSYTCHLSLGSRALIWLPDLQVS